MFRVVNYMTSNEDNLHIALTYFTNQQLLNA